MHQGSLCPPQFLARQGEPPPQVTALQRHRVPQSEPQSGIAPSIPHRHRIWPRGRQRLSQGTWVGAKSITAARAGMAGGEGCWKSKQKNVQSPRNGGQTPNSHRTAQYPASPLNRAKRGEAAASRATLKRHKNHRLCTHREGREHEKLTSQGEEGDAEGGKGCGGGSEGSAVARLWSDTGVLVLTGWPQKPGGRSCLGRRVDEAPD